MRKTRFLVKINVPNKIFHINGKVIRSPLEAVVVKSDLKLIKTRINSFGLKDKDYSIEEYKEKISETNTFIEDSIPIENLPPADATIEELEEKSTLDRILEED